MSNPKKVVKKSSKESVNSQDEQSIQNRSQTSEVGGNYTKYSEKIFANKEELKAFVLPGPNQIEFICKFCEAMYGKEASVLKVKNLRSHVAESDKHEIATPKKYKKDLESLKIKYEKEELARKQNQLKITEKQNQKNFDDARNYLEFLAFTMAENYSFDQISRLGKFLKDMKQRGLSFIERYSFTPQEISKVSSDCFGPFILDKLKEKLEITPYSLSIDSVTVAGENIFALKAKYLEKKLDKDFDEKITSIQNKIIGIQSFKESSKAKDMMEIINNKLFSNEQIQRNLKGIVHDNASVLSSDKNGLLGLLNKDERVLFDLKDPCHGLNLSVNKALESLPSDIMMFIISIHNHFISPQRCATLRRIQEENDLPIKKLKKYVKTRWLSLGISLDRLMEIWDSLKLYSFSKLDLRGKEEKEQIEFFRSILSNDLFKIQIQFLAYIVGRVNYFNEVFQNQKLTIEKLKETLQICYRTILRMAIPSEKVTNKNVPELLKLNWEEDKFRKRWFASELEFIEIASRINGLEKCKDLKAPDKQKFSKVFQDFLGKVLNNLAFYLPLDDEVIEMLDFVELADEQAIIEAKIRSFNERFKIIQDDQKQKFEEELVKLSSKSFNFYRKGKKNTLHIWDHLEEDGFINLSNIAWIAHSLPTSSANIEQSFSQFKLIKTNKRNRLSQSNLESLLLITDHYRDLFREKTELKDINVKIIDDSLVEMFLKLRIEINVSKNVNKIEKNIVINQSQNDQNLEERVENGDMVPLIEEPKQLDSEHSKSSKRKTPLNNPEEINSVAFPLMKSKPSKLLYKFIL